MFRGTSRFHHSADDDTSAPPTPKELAKKKQSSTSKNPYLSRGLDKFSSVLSELEARREKIMEKAGAKGPAIVRFMYSESSSQDWIPIVVRLPPEDGSIQSSPKKPDPTQPKPGRANGSEEERVVGRGEEIGGSVVEVEAFLQNVGGDAVDIGLIGDVRAGLCNLLHFNMVVYVAYNEW